MVRWVGTNKRDRERPRERQREAERAKKVPPTRANSSQQALHRQKTSGNLKDLLPAPQLLEDGTA